MFRQPDNANEAIPSPVDTARTDTHRAVPVRRPMMGVAVCFIAGALAGLFLAVPAPLLLAGAWGALVAAWFLRAEERGNFALGICLLLAAWAHATWHMHHPAPNEPGSLMTRSREHARLVGVIVSDPHREPHQRPGEGIHRFRLRLEGQNRVGHWQKASGLVDVQWRTSVAGVEPAYGDRWHVTGVLTDLAPRSIPWAFLPRYRLVAHGADARRVGEGYGSRLMTFCVNARRVCAEHLGRGLEAFPDQRGILRALLLGYREEVPEDLHRLFSITGTLHIFAISGLHVGVFAALIIALLKSAGVSTTRWALVLTPMLILYTIMTGMRPSAVRACVMAVVFFSAFLFARRPDVPSALALAAMLILIVDPVQLVAPGFIFSFVIVAGLVRLYPLLADRILPWAEPDPFMTRAMAPRDALPRRLLRWTAGLLVASIAAWFASAPLTAYYFNIFAPVALVGNLLVIPSAFVVVLTGCLSLLTAPLSLWMAEVFNHANRLFISGLIGFVDALSQVPGGYRYVESPSWPHILPWYALIFGGLVLAGRRSRRIGLVAVGAWVAGVLAWQVLDRRVDIHVLDAGDGHAVLIKARGSGAWLYDAGPRFRADRVIAYLRAQGINRLDALTISNPSAPHAGGAALILETFPVGELWLSPDDARTPTRGELFDLAEQYRVPVVHRAAGMTGRWRLGVEWEVLHPEPGPRARRAADASLILRLTRGGESVLLMGGANERSEREALTRPVEPVAQVVVVGNQGALGVLSEEWLNAVDPEQIVIAVGRYNRQGFPDRDVLMRAERRGVPVWRTDDHGAVRIRWRERGGVPGLDPDYRITAARSSAR